MHEKERQKCISFRKVKCVMLFSGMYYAYAIKHCGLREPVCQKPESTIKKYLMTLRIVNIKGSYMNNAECYALLFDKLIHHFLFNLDKVTRVLYIQHNKLHTILI